VLIGLGGGWFLGPALVQPRKYHLRYYYHAPNRQLKSTPTEHS
jgi:hypothetical protein